MFLDECGSSVIVVLLIEGTFADCVKLKNISEISSGVKDMELTFAHCTSLEKSPMIPDSVTNMNGTFSHCHNLKEVTSISSNVETMQGTFDSCPKLNVIPPIPAGVTYESGVFDERFKELLYIDLDDELIQNVKRPDTKPEREVLDISTNESEKTLSVDK